jgi:hypothetical protein
MDKDEQPAADLSAMESSVALASAIATVEMVSQLARALNFHDTLTAAQNSLGVMRAKVSQGQSP